jgi:phage shock protein PspC (stress-responsive transcriptional regulator)
MEFLKKINPSKIIKDSSINEKTTFLLGPLGAISKTLNINPWYLRILFLGLFEFCSWDISLTLLFIYVLMYIILE